MACHNMTCLLLLPAVEGRVEVPFLLVDFFVALFVLVVACFIIIVVYLLICFRPSRGASGTRAAAPASGSRSPGCTSCRSLLVLLLLL